MKIAMIDPSGWTYYYDCILVRELSKYCYVELFTEKFEYDSEFSPAFDRINHIFLQASNTIGRKIRSKKITLFIKGIEYLKNLVDTYYFLKNRRFDLVHIQWCPLPLVDIIFIKILKKYLKVPVVYTAHDVLPHKVRIYHKWIFSKLYDAVNKIIVHSDSISFELSNLFSIDHSKISVVEHFLFDNYHVLNPSKKEARSLLNINLDEKVGLFFGRIEEYKGLDILLEAVALLKKMSFSFKLIIAGACKNFLRYQQIIDKYSIDSNIIKFIYFCPSILVEKLLCAVDVLILPYKKTYSSGVLLTGIEFSKPAIVTQTGHLPELIKDGIHGFVVPPNNSRELANAIYKFFNLPEEKIKEMEKEVGLLRERFSPNKIAKKTYDLYCRILKSNAR